MGTDAADPQDLLRTIGVERPMGELALDLYRPNPANLPAVVEALAREAGLDVQPTRSHFDLLELVRVARLDPIDAQCRAVLDHCAPIVSDPLLPVRLVIERPPKGPCAEKQSPLVLSPLSLRERHVRVMRHLRERPALP